MDIQQAVARNAKALREKRRLTLDAAAQATGVSRSMLAQIERGDANPTISVLWKIANGYHTSFSALTERSVSGASLLRGEELVPMLADEGRYVNYPLFSIGDSRPFETYRIRVAPGGFLRAEAHRCGTEELVTVFMGEMEITAGDSVYHLGKEDSLRFLADVPHSYRNPGEAFAELHMLIHYRE